MTATLFKLAFAGIRSRVLASALTIALAGAAAATIAIALEVRASALDPWERTFAAANGAHVLASARSEAEARVVAALPGVAERADPVPSLFTSMDLPRGSVEVRLAGLQGQPRVDAPVPTEGSALRPGGIVLERSFAGALDIPIGTTIEVAAESGPIRLEVVGTAIQSSQERYPLSQPGAAWITRATLERIEPDRSRWSWTQAIRLTDPSSSTAFTQRVGTASCEPNADVCHAGAVYLETWQEQRDHALGDTETTAIVLTTFSLLLLIVVFAVVAILVGARAGEQYREIGLLKAAGLTPRQLSAVFALESAVLGLVGVVVGFVVGAILAPRVAATSAETLLGSPTTQVQLWHVLVAAAAVLLVLLASTLTSARRGTRFTVLQAIRAGAGSPPARSRLARRIARSSLPLPIALGLKDLLARRQRALLLAAAIALTGAVIVAALAMEATIDREAARELAEQGVYTDPSAGPTLSPVPTPDDTGELRLIVYALDAVLLVITLTALVAVALLSVRERIRDYGVLKAIGLTPTQITSSLVSAHSALAVVAALLSIPLGIGLYLAVYGITNGATDNAVIAPWWWLALVPIGTLVMAALATILPARLATRIPTAEALRYE